MTRKLFFKFLDFFQNSLLTCPLKRDILSNVDGALAQLVAHNTGSVGVSGSNPLCSTQDLQKCKSFFVVSCKIRKFLPVKPAKWGTPFATYRNWYRKTQDAL